MILKDVSLSEFHKIKEVILDYSNAHKDEHEKLDRILSVLSSVPDKLPIVLELDKEEFRTLVILTDYYNVWKTDNRNFFWDYDLEKIHHKLTKKFIRIYKKSPYPNENQP
jgi:hypothetical protein